MTGHGPGIMTIMTGKRKDYLGWKINKKANIAKYIKDIKNEIKQIKIY